MGQQPTFVVILNCHHLNQQLDTENRSRAVYTTEWPLQTQFNWTGPNGVCVSLCVCVYSWLWLTAKLQFTKNTYHFLLGAQIPIRWRRRHSRMRFVFSPKPSSCIYIVLALVSSLLVSVYFCRSRCCCCCCFFLFTCFHFSTHDSVRKDHTERLSNSIQRALLLCAADIVASVIGVFCTFYCFKFK